MAYDRLPRVDEDSIRTSTEMCRSISYVDTHVIPTIPAAVYGQLTARDAATARELGNGWLEGAIVTYHAVALQCRAKGEFFPDLESIPTDIVAGALDPRRVERPHVRAYLRRKQPLLTEQLVSDEQQYKGTRGASDIGRDSMLFLLTYAATRAHHAKEDEYAAFLREMESELSNAGALPVENQDLPTAAADIRQHLRRRR